MIDSSPLVARTCSPRDVLDVSSAHYVPRIGRMRRRRIARPIQNHLPFHRNLNPAAAEREAIATHSLDIGMALHKAFNILFVFDLLQSFILERGKASADARFLVVCRSVEVFIFSRDIDLFEF